LADWIRRRIYAIFTILKRQGAQAMDWVAKVSGYTPWFLYQFMEMVEVELALEAGDLSAAKILESKRMGYSDKRIANLTGKTEKDIEELRTRENLHPAFHFVDTCAGEFAAKTPFFYSTYGEMDEGGASGPETVVILASGPNRIGQGLEFDTCCTLASVAYRKQGRKTIVINSNPETLSTDYNISDRLYLEPLNYENVREIMRKEKVTDVVVQLGGQTPLNMAEALEQGGFNIIGTPVKSIHDTEDRGLFADLIRRLGLRQPENRMAANAQEVYRHVADIGYPVLLRPSFVLGGRSMFIAYSQDELEVFLKKGVEMSAERPVLVDQFLEDAYEYDVDAICEGENVYVGGIMQHIEAAGVHSGDSACVFPPFEANPEVEKEMIEATAKIARDIGVRGFLNIQFAVKDNLLYILEVNPRASRTVPFLAKASGVNLIDAVVRSWLGEDLKAKVWWGKMG
jgi:carbamoyl-phosphate synthase large subunit